MRMLSGEESEYRGTRVVGHQVVMEYFAQDEATRLNPALTVYETLEAGSAHSMVPAIRNILGGFLFSGDDVYKKASVLSGGERTRLAVARMLLRPSNTLLLDEPTNHLDLDSKDVFLEALEDYGGTLVIVSHDRYFVEKIATKIIEIGHGEGAVYPGTYDEFLWHKEKGPAAGEGRAGARERPPARGLKPQAQSPKPKAPSPAHKPQDSRSREDRKREEAERRKQQRAVDALRKRIADLESRIAEREGQVRDIEASMGAPGFYDDPAAANATIDRHKTLMWDVGDLIAQWEALQAHASES